MVRFLCEKCRQEAAWVCQIGSQDVCLCRECEEHETKSRPPGSVPTLKRVAHLNRTEGEKRPLLCGGCKESCARVFSVSDKQVFCWKCSEAKAGSESQFLVLGHAVSVPPSTTSSQPLPSSQHPGKGGDGFPGWPSDSDDSLLIEFSNGLAPNWTGESEFLKVDWLGTGLLKTSSEKPDTDEERNAEKNEDKDHHGNDVLPPFDQNLGITSSQPPLTSLPPLQQSLGGAGQWASAMDSVEGSLYRSLSTQPQLSQLKTCGVVPGVPYGMVPVSVPPAFSRRTQTPREEAKRPSRRSASRRSSSMGDIETLMPSGEGTVMRQTSMPDGDTAMVNQSQPGTAGGPQRRCTHCGASKTPQWRAGPFGQKTLCNACGVKYKAGRLSVCGTPPGRGRRVGQLTSQRKVLMASQGQGA